MYQPSSVHCIGHIHLTVSATYS